MPKNLKFGRTPHPTARRWAAASTLSLAARNPLSGLLPLLIAIAGLYAPIATAGDAVRIEQFGDWQMVITPRTPGSAGLATHPTLAGVTLTPAATGSYIPPAPATPAANSTETAALPATSGNVALPVITPCHHQSQSAIDGLARAAAYEHVYNMIPWSITEYRVNPGYRHQATMELLLGQLRTYNVTNTTVNVTNNDLDHGYGWGLGAGFGPQYWYYPYYRVYRRP